MTKGLRLTRKGNLILLLCSVLLFYSYLTLRYEIIAYATFLILLLLLDLAYLTKNAHKCIIKGGRIKYSNKILLGSSSEIYLELMITNGKGLLFIKDLIPKELTIIKGKNEALINIKRDTKVKLKYIIKPIYRGDFYLGPIIVYFTSVLGLAVYTPSIELRNSLVNIKVVPSFYTISVKPLTIMHKLAAPHGGHPIRSKGIGVELEYLREYMPGDDYKKIAWKPTARNPRRIPYVKETKTEIMLETMLVIDPSIPSSLGYKKRIIDYYVEAAGAILLTAHRLGDPIGIYITGIPSHLTIPSRRKEMLSLAIEALETLSPQIHVPRLISVVDVAKRVLSHRTIIILFTTLEGISKDEVEYIVNSLKALNHIPVFIIPYTPSFTPKPKGKYLYNLYVDLVIRERKRLSRYVRLLKIKGALVSVLPRKYFIEGALNLYYSLREMG